MDKWASSAGAVSVKGLVITAPQQPPPSSGSSHLPPSLTIFPIVSVERASERASAKLHFSASLPLRLLHAPLTRAGSAWAALSITGHRHMLFLADPGEGHSTQKFQQFEKRRPSLLTRTWVPTWAPHLDRRAFLPLIPYSLLEHVFLRYCHVNTSAHALARTHTNAHTHHWKSQYIIKWKSSFSVSKFNSMPS